MTNTWPTRLLKLFFMLTAGTLLGSTVQCDLDDGEFNLDLDGLFHSHHDDEFFVIDDEPFICCF